MKKVAITDFINTWLEADANLAERSENEECEYHSDSAYKGYALGFEDGVNSQLAQADSMTLNEYQEKAMTTCMNTCSNMSYMLTNLCAEVGELTGKVAKAIRKGHAVYRDNHLTPAYLMEPDSLEAFDDMVREMALEAGDVLWQLSGVVKRLGFSLEDIAIMNLKKLESRAQRGKIDGDGDHR